MKKSSILFSLVLLFAFVSCDKNEDPDINNPIIDSEVPNDPERVDYELVSANDSGVTGVASFIPNDDGSTTVYIDLENATREIHPATINLGSLEDQGTVAITLNACECEISETLVTERDNGEPISFVELMTFDGHLNIYESPSDGTIIARANIGSNAF